MSKADHLIVAAAIELIALEHGRAEGKFGAFHNAHEGYAVILEEMDELWAAIKEHAPLAEVRKEAIQVAAMALRFLVDLPLCGEGNCP